MQVCAIDHVNILTDDLAGTVRFYEDALGLVRSDSPAAGTGMQGAWMRDGAGNALIHLVGRDPASSFGAGHVPGTPTGAIHHVALAVQGFDAARARLEALGIDHRANEGRYGLWQIFVSDPNGVTLELNFANG